MTYVGTREPESIRPDGTNTAYGRPLQQRIGELEHRAIGVVERQCRGVRRQRRFAAHRRRDVVERHDLVALADELDDALEGLRGRRG